ncbi:hypothetical protein D3C87_1608180 [compost metagenome]
MKMMGCPFGSPASCTAMRTPSGAVTVYGSTAACASADAAIKATAAKPLRHVLKRLKDIMLKLLRMERAQAKA